MQEHTGKLSALQVKNAKPKEKPYKLSDGRGLNLEVRQNGSKYWRLSYRFNGKQKTLALGVFPELKKELKKDTHKLVDKKK
jgi:hypothetical protein